jgi:hypothetical protein
MTHLIKFGLLEDTGDCCSTNLVCHVGSDGEFQIIHISSMWSNLHHTSMLSIGRPEIVDISWTVYPDELKMLDVGQREEIVAERCEVGI